MHCADGYVERIMQELKENLQRNVAADKARREKQETEEFNGMNGLCCK
jgi:hypothetical protein